MIVNFETTNTKKSFINIQINNIKKDTTLNDNETFYSSDNIEEYSNEQELSNNLLVPKQNKIIILQDILISSLDYLSNQRLLIPTLPEEINIKFTNTSFTDKLKSFFEKNELAEVNLNSNTIYISSDLLSKNPKDQFLQEFSHKFQDKQSLIDAFFYHEFAHVIFKNTFNNVFNIYYKLTDNYPEINNKQFSHIPLYQVLRNLEENFADSFSAFIHKNKHNLIDLYSYFSARNATTQNNSLGFDINVNSIGTPFKQVNNIIFNNDSINNSPIDEICKTLYKISLESTLSVIEKTIKTNPQFQIKLIENLTKLNCFNNNYTDSINTLLSLENPTIILTQQNISDVKNRMFSIRNKLYSNIASTIQPTI